MRVGWPCPTSALAVATREIGLGLRRFIPTRGSAGVPGAMWERAASFSIGGAGARTGSVRRLLELGEDVVGAAGDLARDGKGGALAAAAALDGAVQVVV